MNKRNRAAAQRPLGALLVEEGVLTRQQLDYALQLQQDAPDRQRLGDVLVRLGYVTKRQLREIGRKHQRRTPLGDLLVEGGAVTEERLQEALDQQRVSGGLLGEALIQLNTISEEQLARALSQQLDYPFIIPAKALVDKNALAMFDEGLLRRFTILPLFRTQDTLTVLVHNPLDPALIEKLDAAVKGKYELAIGPRSQIRQTLDEVLRERALLSPALVGGELDGATSAFNRHRLDPETPRAGRDQQIAGIVDYILASAIQERASDIHIEPLYNRQRVRFRIDGELIYRTDFPLSLAEAIVRRIKVLARIDIMDATESHDGHIYVTLNGADIDLRVSVYPTVLGEGIAIRILSREIGLRDLGDLGMLPRVLGNLKGMLDSPSGFVLFAGPTGAGKTTSLYACLNYLNNDRVKICTLESPVEYSIEGLSQCQIKDPSQAQMNERIRAMMHQDPDVIVFGEVANEATASTAVQAALSGHKVFSTIHTEDSVGAVLRLMDLGLRTYLVSSTGLAVVSQRLLRMVCASCKRPFAPPRELVRQFHFHGVDADRWEFHRGRGCPACGGSGFQGRTGVFEMLAFDDDIRRAFLENHRIADIRKAGHQSRRYISLRLAGFIKALQGQTTLDEALGVLSYSEKQSFESLDLTTDDVDYWTDHERAQGAGSASL